MTEPTSDSTVDPAGSPAGPPTTVETVQERAAMLRAYATHFAPRDWDYTRNHTVRAISLESVPQRLLDVAGYARRDLVNRVLGRRTSLDRLMPVSWWQLVKAHWRLTRHLPDGVLDGGSVITFWEETGEYLQMVQPSVGALVADLMEAHPDLPEVQAIAAELDRIAVRYRQRLAGEPDPGTEPCS